MRTIRQYFEKNEFIGHVTTLLTGTVLASLIPILFSPLIARLYTPDQFGVFALFTAGLGIFVNVVGGRYEMAVLLPKRDSDSKGLIGLTVSVSFLVCALLLLVVYLFSDAIISALGLGELSGLIYFIPPVIWLMSMFKPLNFWLSRHKAFKKASAAKVVQGITGAVFTVIFGLMAFENGLILGFATGWVLFVTLLWYFFGRTGSDSIGSIQWANLPTLAKEYIQFPAYNVIGTLANDIAQHLSLFLIGMFFAAEELGHFNFSRQYVFVPLSLVAVSVSNVYFQRISANISAGNSLKSEFLRLVAILGGAALTFSVLLFFAGEWIFTLVFGEKWQFAGEILSILIFSYAIKFVVSPLSNVLPALKELRLANVFPFVYLALIASLYFFRELNFKEFLTYFVWFEVIAYTVYFAIVALAITKYEASISKAG
jgi:O-antigen/teichoic acid export membrane protein